MDSALYKRNVLKALTVKDVKDAKPGVKALSRSTGQVTLALAVDGMSVCYGLVLQGLAPYLMGAQLTPESTHGLRHPLGELARYMTLLAKVLKVKIPGAGKRLQLSGTITHAVLQLGLHITTLAWLKNADTYSAPPMTVRPGTNSKVLDFKQYTVDTIARHPEYVPHLEAALDLYWRLCFAIYHQPPAALLAENIQSMSSSYPAGTFDLGDPVDYATKAPPGRKPKAVKPVPIPQLPEKKGAPKTKLVKKAAPKAQDASPS